MQGFSSGRSHPPGGRDTSMTFLFFIETTIEIISQVICDYVIINFKVSFFYYVIF